MHENKQLATVQTNPFKCDRFIHEWTPGETVADILEAVEPRKDLWASAHVYLNDIELKPEYYHVVRPKPDVLLTIKAFPHGGDNSMLRTVAFIALAVAVSMIPGGQTWGANLLRAGVYFAGTLAINALIPLKPQELDNGSQESQALSVGAAKNRLTPFGNLPTLLGYYQITPPYAARPVSELRGEDQYVSMLFTLGFKPIEVDPESIKIGNTFLSEYDEVEFELDTGGSADTGPITIYTDSAFEDVAGKIIPGGNEQGYAQHSTAEDCSRVTYEIHFPGGLIKYENNDGKRRKRTVVVTVEYSDTPTGENGWKPVATHSIQAATSVLLRKGYAWKPPSSGKWHIRMRADVDNRDGSGDVADGPVVSNKRFFQILRSYSDTPAINDPNGEISQVAIKIKATDQLNGYPDEVSMYCQSIVPDGAGWTEGVSNNPASLTRYLLAGKPNARPVDPATDIDDASFTAFWDHCDTNNLKFNQIIDSNITIMDAIQNVCRAAYARPAEIDGIWKIIIDQPQTVHRQVFTPRNSWNLSGSKSYPQQISGFRIRFVDETDRRYTQDERIVYADGFSENSPDLLFESLEAIGITNPDQIWKFGRRHLAIAQLQPETFTLNVDIEALVTIIGDLVLIQHDALKQGLGAARVLEITQSTVRLDSAVPGDGATRYAVQFRTSDGQISAYEVNTFAGNQDTLTFTVPSPAGTYADVGDLAVFGEYQRVSQEALIKNIEPGANMSALLTCIPYSMGIYTADTGTIPPYDPLTTDPPGGNSPVIQSIQSDEFVMWRDSGGTLQPRMVVNLAFINERVNVQGIIVQFRIWSEDANNAVDWTSLSILPGDAGKFTINGINELDKIELRTRFLFRDGTSGIWSYYYDFDKGTGYHTVIGKTQPPPALSYLRCVVQASGLREYQFGYNDDVNLPPDVDGWLIRYFDIDNLSGDPVQYGLLDNDSDTGEANIFGLQADNDQPGDYYGLQLVAAQPDWDDMTPLTVGRITHEPFEFNAPFSGQYFFAAVTMDVGGLRSTAVYSQVYDLPPPQLGNSLFYLDHAANAWLEGDNPGAIFDLCSRNPATGFLIGDSNQTWATGGTWEGTGAGTWQGAPVTTFTYTHEAGVISFDTPITSNIRVEFTTDTALGAGTFVCRYAIDGGTFTGNEFDPGDIITNPGTITTMEFEIEVTGAPDDGLRNWVLEGYASA